MLSFTPAGAGGQVRLAGQLPVPVASAAAAVWHDTGYLIGGENNGRPVPAVTTLRLVPAAAPVINPDAPWLGPPRDRSHLAPGSDPACCPPRPDRRPPQQPAADRRPAGPHPVEFPQPGDLAPGQTFLVPDDAFFSPDGRYIIATQEDDFVISVIDIATPQDRLPVRDARSARVGPEPRGTPTTP